MKSITLKFINPQLPWQRPIYMKDGNETDEVIVPSLKSDFQEDIIYEWVAEVERKKLHNKFPRDEALSIIIYIKTSAPVLLPLVCKNVIDALNQYAYTDDMHVVGIIAMQEHSLENTITIAIYPDTRFKGDEDIKSILGKSVIKITVFSKPVHNIIAFPKHPRQQILVNPTNIKQQDVIKAEILQQYNDNPISNNVCISFQIETHSRDSDLDNICLNYIAAMNKLVIKDYYSIDKLSAMLTRGRRNQATITIKERDGPTPTVLL
ncbi:MAG TPA: hypothetical protein VEF53_10080 [Patescibacteria group bacterium]|nr:hypothetical protein [Patescibacteria group bacterium]